MFIWVSLRWSFIFQIYGRLCNSWPLFTGHGIYPKWFEWSLSVKPITPFIKPCKKISQLFTFLLCSGFFFLMERFIFLCSHIHQVFFSFLYVFFCCFYAQKSLWAPRSNTFTRVSSHFFHGCNFTFNSLIHLEFLLLCDVQDGFWWSKHLLSLLFWIHLSLLIPLPQWLNYCNFIVWLHMWG